MDVEILRVEIAKALENRQLLSHPWYQRWEAGELSMEELQDYAEQYRHFEKELPIVLHHIAEQLDSGPAREFVERNLADETAVPSHVELFDQYLDALDGSFDKAPSAAMGSLIDMYRCLATAGPSSGLAGVMAYETQASAVAGSKAEGLRRHYGMDSESIAFWDLHSTMDVDHADWAIEGLAAITEDLDMVVSAARSAADCWWAFLDEREALRTAAVPA